MHDPAIAQQVLDFWFGEMDGEFPVEDRSALWWGADSAQDERVRRQFRILHLAAEAGDLDHWHDAPVGRLACILLLDQFTRMLYRASGNAFRNDGEALRIAVLGVEMRMDRRLPLGQRVFFYMPFMHSEERGIQQRSVELYEQLVRDASPEQQERVRSNLRFAEQHRDVIQRFGRYPHRNKLLGRENTPEERAYLDSGAASWGQG